MMIFVSPSPAAAAVPPPGDESGVAVARAVSLITIEESPPRLMLLLSVAEAA